MNTSEKSITVNTNAYAYSFVDDDIRIEKTANGQETLVFDPFNPLNKVVLGITLSPFSKTDHFCVFTISSPLLNVDFLPKK